MNTENPRIVIITGANSGIGKSAAFRFAEEGDTVIMACRNLERSRPVLDSIKETTQNEAIHLMALDTSSFASVRTFYEQFQSKFPKLDILINNAAYFEHGAEYRLSPDGIELTFATNVAGPYLLTMLLIERLKKSNDPRVLNASSNIIKHFFSPKREIDFDQLTNYVNDRKFSVYKAYCNSKMALLMLTFKMGQVLKGSGIKVNALQINGARMSKETLKKFKWNWQLIARMQNLFFPPPEYIAAKYFEICTSGRFREVTGKLFNDKSEIMQAAPDKAGIRYSFGNSHYPVYAERKDIQERIWSFCQEQNERLNHGVDA
jgi:NAD(P)-dependent dehydrogenase (short-subunit alcohol dehydrogenase family)